VSVVEVLERMGGVATRASLIAATTRVDVDAARAAGEVVTVARGRYALASADAALVAAHQRCGVVSHTSAAPHHGWQVRLPPDLPHVTLPKGRTLTEAQRLGIHLHRTDLSPDDATGGFTTPERTLVDCLRSGRFPDALCVADLALRDGFGRAANAFESALRAIALEVSGLQVVPQVSIRNGQQFLGRPDLVDERLGIVIEADTFTWHGDRGALGRDARRYNRLAVNGWLVLRFTWEDVVLHPDEVALILRAAVAERTERPCSCGRAA